MPRSSFASAVVVDAQGRVLAAAGDQGSKVPLEGPGIERIQLPGGGFLVTREAPPDTAWARFSRAFVHETRSPLNALAIYLELLGSRLLPPDPRDRPEATPDKILTKANDQIRRIEELLRAFGELWGARGNVADLAEIARAGYRFAQHEALRHSIQLTCDICPMAAIARPPGQIVDAFIVLVGGALNAPADSKLHLTVCIQDGREAALAIELQGENTAELLRLLRPGVEALRSAGGKVETGSRGIRAAFPLAETSQAQAQ